MSDGGDERTALGPHADDELAGVCPNTRQRWRDLAGERAAIIRRQAIELERARARIDQLAAEILELSK